ncbi:MAG: DsbA family protein [Chloroflexi bacterium]|nr:DsbA family protein [Chloroflexota bacterium]
MTTSTQASANGATDSGTMSVDFYFDPGCPWAWITSRWIHEVMAVRDVSVHWRSYSLGMLNEGHDNPEFVDKRAMAKKALRMIEALELEGRNDQIGRFYTEMGTRFHVMGIAASDQLMIDSAKEVGVDDKLDVAEDESWDAAVRASLDEARSLVGPDTGTPVITWNNKRHAIFGPVLSPAPTGEAAGKAFDAMVELVENPAFWELKRVRRGGPEFGDLDAACDIPE